MVTKFKRTHAVLLRTTILTIVSMVCITTLHAQEPQQGKSENREGGPRWQYQSEQSEARTYTQPGYAPSIPLEVEQLRNRVAGLEDRAERLEKALKSAIEVINAQTESIQKLSGK